MANSRIMLVCKHCGEHFYLGKGYFGSYCTNNEEMHQELNAFFEEHQYGCCSDDYCCSDNARDHFVILEEGEDLNMLDADVVPKKKRRGYCKNERRFRIMEVKLTEEEIIKTLECCSGENCVEHCPLRKVNDCEGILCRNVLDLIRKLKGGE